MSKNCKLVALQSKKGRVRRFRAASFIRSCGAGGRNVLRAPKEVSALAALPGSELPEVVLVLLFKTIGGWE